MPVAAKASLQPVNWAHFTGNVISRKHMVHDERRNNGGEGKDYFYSVDIFKMLQQSWL